MSQQLNPFCGLDPRPGRPEHLEMLDGGRHPHPELVSAMVTVPAQTAFGAPAATSSSAKPVRSSARSHPKARAQSAWTAWITGGLAASEAEFFQSVSSWSEGTAAQLLRQPWPALSKRPTSAEVQERLRHHLRAAAHGAHTTYLEGLRLARLGVIDELRRARQTEGNAHPGAAHRNPKPSR